MKVKFNPAPDAVPKEQKRELDKLKKLSTEFESFFMKEIIKSMRNTIPKDGLLYGGNAEEIYRSMYDERLAQSMAERGDSGIAQSMYNQLSKAYLASSQNTKETER